MCDIPCIFVYDCNNFTNTCTIVHVLVKLLQLKYPFCRPGRAHPLTHHTYTPATQ
jgi:hypothetical protein